MHYLILALGIGLALMIFTDFLTVKPDQTLGSDFTPPAAENQQDPGNGTANVAPVLGGSISKDTMREYENTYETQLAEILESVIGVGQVEVMVNLDSTPEIVVEKDRDSRQATTKEVDKNQATRDQNDQSRNEKVVVIDGGKSQQPVVVKTMKPKVRGVLIVAKGAENIQVKAWITDAVQKVLEVPAYKISILPKK
ncbi:stage III sporulation protein AG [Brevibacillus dissolubilis]|uniref:stage III sporulation protein AG n=1 Tax=Brevibacillus dissolubilis TaxID=1844116 RepID=UPI0034CDA54F